MGRSAFVAALAKAAPNRNNTITPSLPAYVAAGTAGGRNLHLKCRGQPWSRVPIVKADWTHLITADSARLFNPSAVALISFVSSDMFLWRRLPHD